MDKKGISRKNIFLIVSGTLFFIGLIVLVLAAIAAPTMTSPKTLWNYSGALNFTCISSMINTTNATLYAFNTTAPTNISNLSTVQNITHINQTNFSNPAVSISMLKDGLYNFSCRLVNVTDGTGETSTIYSTNITNITIDNTPPAVAFSGNVYTTNVYINETFEINVSVNDSTMGLGSVRFNITSNNATGDQKAYVNASVSGDRATFNYTFVTSGYADGKYNITVYANDTDLYRANATGTFEYANLNNSETISIVIDNTAPTANYSCNPTTLTIGQEVTCTCTGTDVTAGINYTTDGDTTSETASVITKITTRSAGTFSRSCTVIDRAGNAIATAATASYTVSSPTGSSTGSTSTSGGTPTTSVSNVGSITPTSPATVSNFVSGSGVSEIQVQVTSTASNVKITVNKYESAPAAVTVSLDNVYKYLQINTQNLADKLSTATVKTYVEKSWVAARGIDKEEISLYKYDEVADQWNELTTTYASEDATYYYYNTEVTSFSYFGLAPSSAAVVSEETPTPTPTPTPESTAIPVWVWIIIGVVILAAIIGGGVVLKKRKR